MILYRFKSLESKDAKYTFDILENERLFAAAWSEMNDPLEGYFRYYNVELADAIACNKARYRVCSFSRFYANALLWSHYAGGFSGVCFAVEVDDAYLKHVKYVSSIPEYDGLIVRSADELAQEALTMKLDYWRYEFEVRTLIPTEKLSEGGYFPCSIKGVLYGQNTDELHVDRLKKTCERKGYYMSEVRLCSDAEVLTCDGLATNVRPVSGGMTGWLHTGAGPLMGWRHPYRKCQLCDREDVEYEGGHRLLEKHYIKSCMDGALPSPMNTALLCPTCHRKEHYSPMNTVALLHENRNNQG